jgi:hypothetical protein
LTYAGGNINNNNNRNNNNPTDPQQRDERMEQQRQQDNAIIYGVAFALFAIVVLASRLEAVDVSWDGIGGFSGGDIAGATLWGVSFYYVSPYQLLLVFLGRIETERPSDFLLRRFGLFFGLDVDALDYSAPLALRLVTVAACAFGGFATSYAITALLGDATWTVSTSIGALFAAGLLEAGRPERLSLDEMRDLEAQWQDFEAFANEALVPRGRCFETEIFSSFRRRFGRYRSQEALSDARLRQMIKNWQPRAERSASGWYRGVSLIGSAGDAAASPVIATKGPQEPKSNDNGDSTDG